MHDPIASHVVTGHHHEFGQVDIGQLLHDQQEKPRTAAANIGRVIHHIFILGKQGLHAPGNRFGLREGTTLRQPEVDDDFGPIGQREKLFGNLGQGRDADAEQGDGAEDHFVAMFHARSTQPRRRL